MKICAIIPFYNESKFISEITTEVLKYVDHIIAIDDGSTDNSMNIIPDSNRITKIIHPLNMGKGAALKSGFQKSLELGFDITITIDADLQHDPSYIPKFINEINNYDLVIGNRLNDISNMPFPRILSNKITSKLLSIKTGLKILDSQNGFRAFRNKTLNNLIPTSFGFEAESEILVLAGKFKYKTGHVEIPTIYGEEKSKMRNIQAIKGFLKVLYKF
ncbi:MAG: glycosyltransferase family 2 protein [Melioribacteraceae bacterium]|nr:glycosyltransferase family 2 protein [Melioribacteraceae bacterium]